MKNEQNIFELYTQLKANREREKPTWDTISKLTGITVNTDYDKNKDSGKKGQQLDEFVDDPTSVIAVNQAGDYMLGIMWGTGEDVMNLIPSRYVTDLVDEATVKDYYSWATGQTLYHMNHHDCGYHTSLKTHCYDQVSYGTSGVGIFLNDDFKTRMADNALVARNYGVDNICIDEGKSGQIDYIFVTYAWKVNRIISEFCKKDGEVIPSKVAKLPKMIQNAWSKKDVNHVFNIVCGVYPRSDYHPKYKGKRGAKYAGVWFLDNPKDNNFFYEEDFSERPISITRAIKIRNETYGRSSSTMLMSTMRSVNFMVGSAIEIIEKMGDPALGVWNTALFGDSVLDTSPHGLTVFNSSFAESGKNPAFPLNDIGNPEPLIKFLVPYLNEKVLTAFKIDILLDFSSAKEMTARESMQRFVIRGQSLSGMLLQQKNERLIPDVKRAVSILMSIGELGINPRTMKDAAADLKKRGRSNRVIPEAVLDVMESGRPWYEIKFNNELEKLIRTEAIQNLIQLLNALTAIVALYPDIVHAVDWYQMLKDINDNLDSKSKIIYSAAEFKKKIEEMAEKQRMALALQAGQMGAQIQKDTSQAQKNNREAQNVGR